MLWHNFIAISPQDQHNDIVMPFQLETELGQMKTSLAFDSPKYPVHSPPYWATGILLGTCSSVEQGGKINPTLSCPPHQHLTCGAFYPSSLLEKGNIKPWVDPNGPKQQKLIMSPAGVIYELGTAPLNTPKPLTASSWHTANTIIRSNQLQLM